MKQYVYHHVFIKCSAVRRPPSAVRRPPSAVRRPPSAVRRPSSAVRRPSSVVRRPSSVVRRPPSAVRRPSSAVRRPSAFYPSAFYLHPPLTCRIHFWHVQSHTMQTSHCFDIFKSYFRLGLSHSQTRNGNIVIKVSNLMIQSRK